MNTNVQEIPVEVVEPKCSMSVMESAFFLLVLLTQACMRLELSVYV